MRRRRSDLPVRTCVGCRKARPQVELVRLVRDADGLVMMDVRGGAPGRGAYVCRDASCIGAGLRADRLAHAFRKRCRVEPGLDADVRAAADAAQAR